MTYQQCQSTEACNEGFSDWRRISNWWTLWVMLTIVSAVLLTCSTTLVAALALATCGRNHVTWTVVDFLTRLAAAMDYIFSNFLLLIAQAIFLLECGHTDTAHTHTPSVTDDRTL